MVISEVCATLTASGILPAPSATALNFSSRGRSGAISLEALAHLIKEDSLLCAELFAFGEIFASHPEQKQSTVEIILVRTGLESAVDLIPALSLMSRTRSGPCLDFNYPAFWAAALARALAARLLAGFYPGFRPNALFCSGLLASIGQLGLAAAYPDTYGSLLHDSKNKTDLAVNELSRYAITHLDLGQHMLKQWHTSDDVCHLVQCFLPVDRQGLDGDFGTSLCSIADYLARDVSAHDALTTVDRIALPIRSILPDEQDQKLLVEEIRLQWHRWVKNFATPSPLDPLRQLLSTTNHGAKEAPGGGRQSAAVTILVADDDPLTLLNLTHLLDRPDRKILTAENGKRALEIALRYHPDILITDWRMPELSGIELCRTMRSTDRARHIYIIMLTGRESAEELIEAFDAGADDYVVKPFNPRVLEARIRSGERIVRSQQTIIRDREVIRDYADRLAAANQTLQDLAMTDVLTGLPNRRSALNRLTEVVSEASRHHGPLSCIMIDIDLFKQINDRWGHDTGDRVLKELAAVLTTSARRYDMVSRIGGEEFLIICSHSTLHETIQLAERLREAAAELVVHHQNEAIRITISCGVAAWETTMADGEDMMRAADHALYRAKHLGRNRVEAA